MATNWQGWARRAALAALAGMIGAGALAGDKAPVPLKRGSVSKSKVTTRAQNSDEELFDALLVDQPRVTPVQQSAEHCAPQPMPCDPNRLPVPLPPQYPSPLDPNLNQPMPQAPMVGAPDFGGGMASLGPAGRTPSMMGDFFGGGSTRLNTPGLIQQTPINQITYTGLLSPIPDPLNNNELVVFEIPGGGFPGVTIAPPISPTQIVAGPTNSVENIFPGPDVSGYSMPLNPVRDPRWLTQVRAQLLEDQARRIALSVTDPLNPAALDPSDPNTYANLILPRDILVQRYGVAVQTNGAPFPALPGTVSTDDTFVMQLPIFRIPNEQLDIPAGALAGVMKLSENGSPIPRDRIFLNYNMFSNVDLAPNGVTVNRLSPGFEKTFLNGNMSFELRMPFATTLDSDITDVDMNAYNRGKVEFGNVMTTVKSYLYSNEQVALTGGLGIAFPTADDISVRLSSGTEVLRFNNNAVHMMPFLGGLYTPDSRLFVQSIVQLDAPTNGQTTLYNPDPNGVFSQSGNPLIDRYLKESALKEVGVYTPPTFIYFDSALGYWFYNNEAPSAFLTGVAGMLEFHYNASLTQTDQINVPITTNAFDGPPLPIGLATIGQRRSINQLNILVGSTIELRHNANLQLGYATPIGGDHVFDGEFRCNFNYFFGRNLYGRQYRAGGI